MPFHTDTYHYKSYYWYFCEVQYYINALEFKGIKPQEAPDWLDNRTGNYSVVRI